jgi:hypothetical protein
MKIINFLYLCIKMSILVEDSDTDSETDEQFEYLDQIVISILRGKNTNTIEILYNHIPNDYFLSLSENKICDLLNTYMHTKNIHNFRYILVRVKVSLGVQRIVLNYRYNSFWLEFALSNISNDIDTAKEMLNLIVEHVEIKGIENMLCKSNLEIIKHYFFLLPSLLSNPVTIVNHLYRHCFLYDSLNKPESPKSMQLAQNNKQIIYFILSNQQIPYEELIEYVKVNNIHNVYKKDLLLKCIEEHKVDIKSATCDIKPFVEGFFDEKELATLVQEYFAVGRS